MRSRLVAKDPPKAYVKKPYRWPDGPLDEERARRDGVLPALRMLQQAALAVRDKRKQQTQEALSFKAQVYKDAVNRLERGGAWIDLSVFSAIVAAADLRVVVYDPKDSDLVRKRQDPR